MYTYDKEKTYRRDKERKELNHLLASPARNPTNTLFDTFFLFCHIYICFDNDSRTVKMSTKYLN